MKKLASILGIGMVSMAVALAPAFAQQTQPQGSTGSTTVQPKLDVKTPTGDNAGKDEKNMPVKPGDVQGKQTAPMKPAPDVKATAPAPSPKPMGEVKSEKSVSPKTGTDVKNEGTTSKPGPDVKANSTSKKTDTDLKDQKGTNVKPGANLKSDKPVKSCSTKAMHKHHAKKSSGKVASRMHAKTHASNLDKSKAGK
jgi:hypothetical protein